MRVLLLPWNTASKVSTTVRALREIGVEARGLARDNTRYQDPTGIEVYERVDPKRHVIRACILYVSWVRAVLSAVRWADVVHWVFGHRAIMGDLGLKYAAFLDKARLVNFCGTDVRIPEIAGRDNPYVKLAYGQGQMKVGSESASVATQALFARHGFCAILQRFELVPYLRKEHFPSPFMIASPVLLSEFEPAYPDPANASPRIVHCPSHKRVKGTSAVLEVIERLHTRYDFTFSLLHDVGRNEVITELRGADIVIDQLVIGDYGNLSLEAMALGKPTVCYIKPSVMSELPREFPVVNASQDNLAEVLAGLLEDGQRRYEIGRRSRAYVEKYHDAHKLASELVAIYEELLRKQSKGRWGR